MRTLGLGILFIALGAECVGQTQENASVPIRLPEGTSQALLMHRVQPTYPPLARQARIQGHVVFDAVISEAGTIESLRALSGHPMLTPAAIEAVKRWQYKPYYVKGRPMEVETQITVNFTLSGVVGSDSLQASEKLPEKGDASHDAQSLGVLGISRTDGLGITITRLIPGGPAQLAGLAAGDVITAIDGKPVKRVSEEAELLSNRPEGSSIRISYMRGIQTAEATLVLADQNGNAVDGRQANLAVAQLPVPHKVSIFGMTLGEPMPKVRR